ncbi:hypothetical protein [Marinobacter sp. MIT932201]|uniref:hypothetical protein n=1 Tax=Marinobacter sp. MIT932201 TaxID=3096995 RepID=UPI00399BAB2B
MESKTICQVLKPLFDLGSEVHGNGPYQMELAREIQATGKSARDLTVGELLDLCQIANDRYNQMIERGHI